MEEETELTTFSSFFFLDVVVVAVPQRAQTTEATPLRRRSAFCGCYVYDVW